MKVKKIIGLLVIPVSIGLIFSVQGVRAEKKPENNRQFSLQTDSVKEKFNYAAQDSTKWNKHKSIVALYGKATFSCENFDLTANEIVFNKNT
ncbi:hypothetical protein [Pedobacter cryoconitis]|uniref:Uncharacterized protein n=1 Tax=Pedobacter cryoconitis TaxID=188932 RepID=A0A327T3D9_9SPHI|nr:hypothetical protein [Pedobacter cryoconitis]RAJ35362.1 hypothetical protein LY11_00605 [Pedobacter cryoconitis]